MFDGASNVQLGVEPMKTDYTRLTVMSGVEHTDIYFSMMFPKYQWRIR